MKKGFKTYLVIFIALAIFGKMLKIGGCLDESNNNSSSSTTTETSTTERVKPKDIKLMEIELDDPNGEATLDRNVLVIFDGSGSMSEECANNTKMNGAKEAMKEFAGSLPSDINLGLLVFDGHKAGEVRYPVKLGSNNASKFESTIMDCVPGGGTPLYEAIAQGTDILIEQYKKQLGYGEYRLVIVTDGMADGMESAAIYATERGISLYTISLCMDDVHPLRDLSLYYQEANNYEQLQNALKETVAESEVFDITEFN